MPSKTKHKYLLKISRWKTPEGQIKMIDFLERRR
jgi:hypothetical protein